MRLAVDGVAKVMIMPVFANTAPFVTYITAARSHLVV